MTATRRMIYHTPAPLDPRAASGQTVRRIRMRDAFVELGYDVVEVAGWARDRKRAIREIMQQARNGLQFDFVYAENINHPLTISEPKYFPPHPWLDLHFFDWCRRAGIPVGLFYRDVYWASEEYARKFGRPLTTVLRALYHRDIRGYSRSVNTLYVPSAGMGEMVPIYPGDRMKPLPPGCTPVDFDLDDDRPRLIYVGGAGGYYQMGALLTAMHRAPDVTLTICTRAAEWNEYAASLPEDLSPNVSVRHVSGAPLESEYARVNIASLFVEPTEYRTFAMPIKLFEYVGHGLPIIASAGTLAGDFVGEHGIGWTIPYDADALVGLLDRLATKPGEIDDRAQVTRRFRTSNTWTARAQQVADDLCREAQEGTL